MNKDTLQERVEWQLWVLRACANDETVHALPIQERRAQVIRNLRATLHYYKRLGKTVETSRMVSLCLLVERSTSVRQAISELKTQGSVQPTNVNATPASNTGVTPSEYKSLSDYIAGEK